MNAPVNRVGTIVMLEPAGQMAEIKASSDLLDIALAERLDMEGGPTGRHIHFKPSALRAFL